MKQFRRILLALLLRGLIRGCLRANDRAALSSKNSQLSGCPASCYFGMVG